MSFLSWLKPKPMPCWMGRTLGWGIYIPPLSPIAHRGRILRAHCKAPAGGYCRCANLPLEEEKTT